MSDTDDTDELLLIPPQVDNSEIIESYSVPYYQIVDKLITQVTKLRNRIKSIENSSENISIGSNSIEAFINMRSSDSSNATCRRCFSYESLPNHQYSDYKQSNSVMYQPCFSTQSTPQKPRSKLMLKSFPNSPKTDEESKLFKKPTHRGGVPKSKLDDSQKQSVLVENTIIKEIDDFLLNVKPSTKPEVARTLIFNKILKNGEKQSKTVVDIHQILKEMEEQEEKLKGEEHNEREEKDENKWKNDIENLSMTSSESSLSDKSTVLQQLNLNRSTKQENPSGKKVEQKISNNLERFSSCCSNDILAAPHLEINGANKPQQKDTNFEANLGSVSLINLWAVGKNDDLHQNSEKCIQKLHEEKLRRTHCEELIQKLQNKILEQQEKLAVAIQVDEAKDTAIIRFHDAWEKATLKFKVIVKERDQLIKDAEKLAEQNKKINAEIEERIEFHRKETNEALNMVQDYQRKVEELDKKLNEITSENEMLKSKNQELERKVLDEEEKNKQLSKILADKEIELNDSRNILMHAKKEVSQCQAAVEMCQKDFSTIKTEYDLIQEELSTERTNVSQLHEQNKVLHDELDGHRKKEKSLLDTLKSTQEKLETNKKELRNFYQGQVELLVQTKLKEFQNQLDQAETKMKEELSKKELEIAKSAALHIQQIDDKYSLEINLLEQKHQEEIQLKHVRIAQLEQKIHELQSKFDKQHEKRSELVRQLQKVMEAQWNEALRIINNGKSPLLPFNDSSSTIDQLQSLHSKSHQNVEALLNFELIDEKRYQYNDENDVDRKSHHHHHQHSQPDKNKKTSKTHDCLQKYVNMLLNKQNVDGNDGTSNNPKFQCEQNGIEKSIWQQSDCNKQNSRENDVQEGCRRKTPWK